MPLLAPTPWEVVLECHCCCLCCAPLQLALLPWAPSLQAPLLLLLLCGSSSAPAAPRPFASHYSLAQLPAPPHTPAHLQNHVGEQHGVPREQALCHLHWVTTVDIQVNTIQDGVQLGRHLTCKAGGPRWPPAAQYESWGPSGQLLVPHLQYVGDTRPGEGWLVHFGPGAANEQPRDDLCAGEMGQRDELCFLDKRQALQGCQMNFCFEREQIARLEGRAAACAALSGP